MIVIFVEMISVVEIFVGIGGMIRISMIVVVMFGRMGVVMVIVMIVWLIILLFNLLKCLYLVN